MYINISKSKEERRIQELIRLYKDLSKTNLSQEDLLLEILGEMYTSQGQVKTQPSFKNGNTVARLNFLRIYIYAKLRFKNCQYLKRC